MVREENKARLEKVLPWLAWLPLVLFIFPTFLYLTADMQHPRQPGATVSVHSLVLFNDSTIPYWNSSNNSSEAYADFGLCLLYAELAFLFTWLLILIAVQQRHILRSRDRFPRNVWIPFGTTMLILVIAFFNFQDKSEFHVSLVMMILFGPVIVAGLLPFLYYWWRGGSLAAKILIALFYFAFQIVSSIYIYIYYFYNPFIVAAFYACVGTIVVGLHVWIIQRQLKARGFDNIPLEDTIYYLCHTHWPVKKLPHYEELCLIPGFKVDHMPSLVEFLQSCTPNSGAQKT